MSSAKFLDERFRAPARIRCESPDERIVSTRPGDDSARFRCYHFSVAAGENDDALGRPATAAEA
jgi:hypothetical protein